MADTALDKLKRWVSPNSAVDKANAEKRKQAMDEYEARASGGAPMEGDPTKDVREEKKKTY